MSGKYRFFVMILLLLVICGTVSADYSFSVPTAVTELTVNDDGSMDIVYEYTFKNNGQKLDFIDIGTPNNNFYLPDVKVWVNDKPGTEVKVTQADYNLTGLRYGISLEMGTQAIPHGRTGTVKVRIPNLRKNLYPAVSETFEQTTIITATPGPGSTETGVSETDVPNPDGEIPTPVIFETTVTKTLDYAGFQFSPNWFGSSFTTGTTDYTFTIKLPAGLPAELAFYYKPQKWIGISDPEAGIDESGRVFFTWHSKSALISTQYTFGAKFPTGILSTLINYLAPTATPKPRPTATPRPYSSGSSYSPGSSSSGKSGSSGNDLKCFAVAGIFFAVCIFLVKKGWKKEEDQSYYSTDYSSPSIQVNGTGIKRGLTAVEAAILLEKDLDQIISMILYGLCKKEVITVRSLDPLQIETADPLPAGLYPYEKDFIQALNCSDGVKRQKDLTRMLRNLMDSVSRKLDDYSVNETKQYYQNICDKAWKQVEDADTPELKQKLLGDELNWLLLNDQADTKFEKTFANEEVMMPGWWQRAYPVYPATDDRMPRNPDPDSQRDNPFLRPYVPATPSTMPPVPRPQRQPAPAPRTPYIPPAAVPNAKPEAAVRPAENRQIPQPAAAEERKPAAPVLPGANAVRDLTKPAVNYARDLTNSISSFFHPNRDQFRQEIEEQQRQSRQAAKERLEARKAKAIEEMRERRQREAYERSDRRKAERDRERMESKPESRSSSRSSGSSWFSGSSSSDRSSSWTSSSWTSSSSSSSSRSSSGRSSSSRSHNDSCACACAGGGR